MSCIVHTRHIVLMAAARLDAPVKGLHVAVDALNRLAASMGHAASYVVSIKPAGNVAAAQVLDDVALAAAPETHRPCAGCLPLDERARQSLVQRCGQHNLGMGEKRAQAHRVVHRPRVHKRHGKARKRIGMAQLAGKHRQHFFGVAPRVAA